MARRMIGGIDEAIQILGDQASSSSRRLRPQLMNDHQPRPKHQAWLTIVALSFFGALFILTGCSRLDQQRPSIEATKHGSQDVTTEHSIDENKREPIMAAAIKLASLPVWQRERTKRTVAVLAFTQDDHVTPEGEQAARDFAIALIDELRARQLDRIVVITRTHLADVVDEQGRSLSPAFDESRAPELGRLLRSDYLVTGTIVQDKETRRLSIQLIDVQSGAIHGGARVSLPPSSQSVDVNHSPAHAANENDEEPHDPSQPILEIHTSLGMLLSEANRPVDILIWAGAEHIHRRTAADEHQGPHATDGQRSSLLGNDDPLRKRIQVCLIVDVSGSMNQFGRLRYAKQAALEVLKHLRPSDQFCLVSFNQRATVLVPLQPAEAQAKHRAQDVILGMRARGSTNFESALHSADTAFRQQPKSHMIRHAILISDGQPTAGAKDPATLATQAHNMSKNGIVIDTVGVGEEILIAPLEAIAEHGEGRFHGMINANSLATFLTSAVAGAATYLAESAVLTFEPAPGIKVVQHGRGWRTVDGKLVAKLGLIRAGETVTRTIRVAPVKAPTESRLPLGQARLAYLDPLEQEWVLTQPSAIQITRDAALEAQSINPDIMRETLQKELLTVLKDAHDLVRETRYEEAKNLIRHAAESAREAISSLQVEDQSMSGLEDLLLRIDAYLEALERGDFETAEEIRLFKDATDLRDRTK